MGKIVYPKPVALVMALMADAPSRLEETKAPLVEKFGSIELESETYPFTYSSHYEKEMGKGLIKQFVSFANLVEMDSLGKIKTATNRLEEDMAIRQGKQLRRTLNIDPGYLSLAQLVLATTKNYSHRIYLGGGIFAELTLIYRQGGFRPLDWTYPDYRSELAGQFFVRVRGWLFSKICFENSSN
ncbi:MAG: DUF4416 family protein, partial [Candidatus Latescibacteria bacterium]|nr:DUF4416 family protein [Candidatus Latescibacterota bacterium]